MEFNTNKRDALDEAVKPRAIKAQTRDWTSLEGFVYVISKKMPIRQNGKMINCVKIGMSNLNTREGFDKSYTRLLNFRTTLVSYNLHRIYLFTANDNDANDDEPMGLSAYNAEQTIHKLIDNKFKPKQLRIQFPNGGKSEWWDVKEKMMDKFLKFIDTRIMLDTEIPPVWGTGFTEGGKIFPIKFPVRPLYTGVRVDEGQLVRRQSSRQTNNKYSRNLRVRKTRQFLDMTKKQFREINRQQRKEMLKSEEFWEAMLVGKKFVDPKMDSNDDGRYPNKVITAVIDGKKVYKNSRESFKKQFFVQFEPDLTPSQERAITQKEFENAEGEMTVNEALEYLDEIRNRHIDSYDFYVAMNKYDKNFDYTAPVQQPAPVEPVLSVSRRRRRPRAPPKPKVKNVPQNLKGRFVRKQFSDGNYYLGLIKSVGRAKGRLESEDDDEDKTIYANVVYEDGDREDVDFNELSDIILSKAEERVYLNLHNKPAFG